MVDWPGLLKWSLQFQDETRSSDNIKPMSEEDKKWLAEALESYSFDDIKRIKQILSELREGESKLRSEEEEKGEEKQDEGIKEGNLEEESKESKVSVSDGSKRVLLLEELLDITEQTANSSDFIKLGGLNVILNEMFNCKIAEVRLLAGQIFSSLVQNNPEAQECGFNNGANQIADLFALETLIPNKEQALSSLSSFLRGQNVPAKNEFLNNKGLQFVFNILENEECTIRMKNKCLSILNDLLFYHDKIEGSHRLFFHSFLKENQIQKYLLSVLSMTDRKYQMMRELSLYCLDLVKKNFYSDFIEELKDEIEKHMKVLEKLIKEGGAAHELFQSELDSLKNLLI